MEITIRRKDACTYLRAYNPQLKLGKQLGTGGTAVVYDLPGTFPPQVVKMMDPRGFSYTCGHNPAAVHNRERMYRYFKNEIATMLELRLCKHIMPILDTFEYVPEPSPETQPEDLKFASVFLILMPKLETVTNYIERVELKEPDMVRMGIDICTALQACAEKNLLHRDVKPENIFVSGSGKDLHFILGDFGLCCRLSAMVEHTTRCGTPEFMAPEVEYGKPVQGFSSDLFSLGSSLYYLLSGGNFPNKYYSDQNQKGIREHEIAALPKIKKEFSDIILKSVQINPAYRQQSAAEMKAELERLTPQRESVVVDRQYFLSVKHAMLNRNFTLAIEKAKEGVKARDKDCRRLLAYCLYHEYSAEEAVTHYAVRLLDELAYDGDPIAQCLRAIIHAQNKQWDAFYTNIRESAEAGCVIAQYYYGRALCDGWDNRKQDLERGADFVMKSAQANYLPALQYSKRHLSKRCGSEFAECLRSFLVDDSILLDQERLRADIVKYL